jgi:hypothetical protein
MYFLFKGSLIIHLYYITLTCLAHAYTTTPNIPPPATSSQSGLTLLESKSQHDCPCQRLTTARDQAQSVRQDAR